MMDERTAVAGLRGKHNEHMNYCQKKKKKKKKIPNAFNSYNARGFITNLSGGLHTCMPKVSGGDWE